MSHYRIDCLRVLAPRNLTVVALMLVCGLFVSGAINPLEGMIKASSAPMCDALEHFGKQESTKNRSLLDRRPAPPYPMPLVRPERSRVHLICFAIPGRCL